QKATVAEGKLTQADREQLWQRLADADAAVAFQAICQLVARTSEAVAILEDGWKRSRRATPKQVHKWIEELGSDQFMVRKTATEALHEVAADHEDFLRDAVKQTGTLEVRQRLEKIIGPPSSQRLRRSRMLEVLEQLRTVPARQFLQALAEQKEDVVAAREATAGLKRLEPQGRTR